MTKDGVTWTYTYDANGMRTKRTDGTNTYEYVYNGDKLMQMTRNGEVIRFSYAGDIPITMTYDGDTFYYITNAQGDVTGITDGTGKLLIGYLYNGWRATSYTLADTEWAPILVNVNPLMYRGYVYDRETKLFYLQSRYYDPELGRFISPDTFVSTGQGILGNNMFAYCGNNPVNYCDPTGTIRQVFLGDNHIFSDEMLTSDGGGGSDFYIPTSKQASEEVIEREIWHIKNGTYDQYINYIQDRYAVFKLGNGVWKVIRGVAVSLVPDPTFITDIKGAADVANGLRLIVSALLEWTDEEVLA